MPYQPTPLETVELVTGTTRARLAPERGGMATRFFVGDRAIFAMDEATLVDRAKNVRGGNPILFPSPGKLVDDRWARDGKRGVMGQHGFARNEPWTVLEANATSATLELRANERTRAVFDHDFVLRFRYSVRDAVLRIDQHFETSSPTPVPFGIGFHPYFYVPDGEKRATAVRTTATRAYDNRPSMKKVVELHGIDLTADEVDLHLHDHGRTEAVLVIPDGRRIEVRGSSVFQQWVVWTLKGKDFVCLEPWSCFADALNTGVGLSTMTKDSPLDAWLEIALVPTD